MALEIKNISTTINSVSCLFDIVPPVTHTNWSYSLSGGSYVLYSQTDSYRINCTITGLKENTTYTLRARAVNASTFVTVYSSTVSFTTKKSTTAPTVSASITAATAKGFTINGTANYPCRTWQYQIDGGAWQSLSATTSATSVSKEIPGLNPATTYAVRVRATRTYNGVRGTSATVNATTLGASVLNSVNTVVADDETVSVNFNWTVQPGTGYTNVLRIKDGGTLVVEVTGLTGASGAKSIELTGPQRTALLARMPNKKSFTGTFELETLDGATRVGALSTKTATVTTTEANSAPAFTGYTMTEENTKVTAVTPGELIQSLSDIKVVCNPATAKNGASIVKYGVTFGGKTVEDATTTVEFGEPVVGGTGLPLAVWVEDSRGYRTTLTENKTVWVYSKPIVAEWLARRKDSVGEETALTVIGNVRTVVSDTLNGLKKAEYRLRESDGAFGAWQTLTGLAPVGGVVSGRQSYEYDKADWETLDADKSYIVEVRFQDEFETYSTVISFTVIRGIPLVSFRDEKVGINQPNPQAALDIIGGLIVDGTEVDPLAPGQPGPPGEQGPPGNSWFSKVLVGSITVSATVATHSFASAFSSAPYMLACWAKTASNTDGAFGSLKISSITTTGFKITAGGSIPSSANGVMYIAFTI